MSLNLSYDFFWSRSLIFSTQAFLEIQLCLLTRRATSRYISNYDDIHHVDKLWNEPLKIKIFLIYFHVDLIYHAV